MVTQIFLVQKLYWTLDTWLLDAAYTDYLIKFSIPIGR